MKTKESIPFYERREVWCSPYAIFLIIGFVVYGISYGFYWILKWILISWVRPFTNSVVFCNKGFHKYRYKCDIHGGYDSLYKCVVCDKEMTVNNSD